MVPRLFPTIDDVNNLESNLDAFFDVDVLPSCGFLSFNLDLLSNDELVVEDESFHIHLSLDMLYRVELLESFIISNSTRVRCMLKMVTITQKTIPGKYCVNYFSLANGGFNLAFFTIMLLFALQHKDSALTQDRSSSIEFL